MQITEGKMMSDSAGPKEDEKILKPLLYMLKCQTRGLSHMLVPAFNHWLRIADERKLELIYQSAQISHKAIIMLDDLVDGAPTRGGKPASQEIHGVPLTLNAANYAYFVALEKLKPLKSAEAIKIFVGAALERHRGEGLELFWRDNFACPTEEEYIKNLARKDIGILFVVRLMQAFSDNKADLTKIATDLAAYIQIRDDYCRLWSSKTEENEGFGEDITQVKFSLPVIHGIRSHPEEVQLIYILRQKTKDAELKRHFLNLLDEFGSFAHTREVLAELEEGIRDEIRRLGGNPLMEEILDKCRLPEDLHRENGALAG